MRKHQADLNFGDSNPYRVQHAVESMGEQTMDVIYREPMRMRGSRRKVICLECSTSFFSNATVPECPGCGGSDIDLK